MDNLQRAIVSVSIAGDDLVPTHITTMLGGQPNHGVGKGEIFLARHGKYIEARTGMWRFGGEWVNSPHLDRQISDLLAGLTTDMAAWSEVTSRYECYLSVGGYFHDWTGGMNLHPDTLRLLADRNLPIDFDLYAPSASR